MIVLAVGGLAAAGKAHGNVLDRPIDSWIHARIGSHYAELHGISTVGLIASEVAAAVIVAATLATRRLNAAALTVISVPVAFVLTEYVLKPLVHERINSWLTYPSGHTQAVFCVVAIAAVLLVSRPRSSSPAPWLRVLIVILAAGVGCAVGVAMIGMGFHYFTDTVGGAAVGCGVVLATAFGLDRPGVRRRLGRPSIQRPNAPMRRSSTF